jgi:hypothetical protein
VEQHRAVRSACPDAAFSIRAFRSAGELSDYLGAAGRAVVLRPEFSAGSGSAVIFRPGDPLTPAELGALWDGAGRVVAHDWVEGNPYFINGIVRSGRFMITDAWRCFSLAERHRVMLTSVLSTSARCATSGDASSMLSAVAATADLPDGPLHCELVQASAGGMKVVKLAPRTAGEPLPSLCRLLGLPGQAGAAAAGSVGELAALLAIEPTGFVADYSFLARSPGRLIRIRRLAELRTRPTYSGDLRMPRAGTYLSQSASGELPAATILLRGHSEAQMLADIDYYQARNAEGIFVVSREDQS